MFGRRFGGDWEDWGPPWMRGGGPPWARGGWGPRGPRFWRMFFGPPWGPWGPGGGWHEGAPEEQALRSTAAEVARLFAIAARSASGNPERQAQLRGFLERSRKELSDMIYGGGQS
ncbi:MAG: hypothetical protein JOZ18_02910 [Chloroflexi bacterium]|nr:hypothetical protein [Chloroflexota bacterium]